MADIAQGNTNATTAPEVIPSPPNPPPDETPPQSDSNPPKKDPERDMYSTLAVWLTFCMVFLAIILQAIYTCTWLGEYDYNVQIARHVCILLWIVFLTWCYNFPKLMSDYYVFPESKATTFFIIGLTYVVTVILLLSDPTLDLLYRGNKGVKYTTMQGTRMLPKLEPRMLFNGIIGLYSAIGAVGVGFWTGMMYMWVSGIDNK
ncbi:hypothetical protein GGH17_004514 [Coemansia sp. RSA 788]|nr:hypothetical protein GGH17_004514 [Coemansia sp. RSA 788]KAJ2189348.1 hypothetical protein EV181_001674 [Coemansia sp. RSA 532]KAJ2438367.1 hypothetical protein IWW46_004923 [Coemansia sp. RSA 2440]KAJ2525949.1 hypothetical protein GGH20_003730 [Coemansia sp. RSA 1937]KAJ2710474.1 hypothetical protein H4S00_006345 [Coemansia sp. D1744]